MTTRRDVIRAGAGLAAILAAGKAPASIVKSMLGARGACLTARRKPKLPYDAEVEYLESTGTQWIDTGIYGDLDTVAELRAAATAADALYPLFGARDGYASKAFSLYNGSDVGYYYTVSFDSTFPGFVYSKSNVPATMGSWVDFSIGETMQVGGWTKDWHPCASAFTTSHTLDLFAWNQNGTITTGKYKVSSCKIYKSGILIRDFIPVRFTNELGQSEGAMYDRVNPTAGMNPDGTPRTDGLYRNRGTGAFLWAEKSAPTPTPIAQTSDGKCKVMSFKDGDSATDFTFGDDWTLEGSGLYGDGAPDGEWMLEDFYISVDDQDISLACNFSGEGGRVEVSPISGSAPAAGVYENVTLQFTASRGGSYETLTLTIPHLVVE